MKKITYISLLFFFTSIFCLFMGLFGLKNTFAYEMKLGNLGYYDFGLYVNTSTGLYNNSFLGTKDIGSNYRNYIKLYDQLGVEKYSFMCHDPNAGSTPTGCPYNLIEFKEYYILFSYGSRSSSFPTTYYIYRNALIINKKDGTFNHIDFGLSSGSFSGEYPKYYVYYKDNIIYLFLGNKYYSLSDNGNYNLTKITNPGFTFFDFGPNTYNKYKLQYVNGFFYFYNRTDIKKEVVFSLNNYSVSDISLPNSFANKKSMNVISYDGKIYFSQESSTGDLQIIGCNSNLTGCASFPNEYYLYFNYIQKKGYKITKTDYDAKNIKNLNGYYGFYDSDSSSYMKGYIKNDSFLYVDNSSLDVFGGGSSSGSTTCTENNSNCTCSYRDSYTFEYKKTFNYLNENILNYKSDYLEKSQYEIGFSYTPNTGANNNSISVALYDFRDVKFNTLTNSGILFENSHFLFNSGSELQIKTAYIDKSYMVIGSTNPFSSFILECKENQGKYFTLLNKDDLSQNEKIYDNDGAVRNANGEFKCGEYVNFQQKGNIAYIKVYGMGETYHISNIILFENTIKSIKKLLCKKNDGTWTLDGEDYLPTDGDVNDFDNNTYGGPNYFGDIKNSINSGSFGSMDVSGSGALGITFGSGINNILSGDFGSGSCRMFGDNLQFLYYSNSTLSLNFSFGDYQNYFINELSFLGEKFVGVFIAPINSVFQLIMIITPFSSTSRDYCIFGNIMTYTPHKIFVGSEYYNKFLLFDYLVLFGYGLFLGTLVLSFHSIFNPFSGSEAYVEEKGIAVRKQDGSETYKKADGTYGYRPKYKTNYTQIITSVKTKKVKNPDKFDAI